MRAQLQSLTDFKRACAAEPIEFRIASGNSVVEWLLVPNLARITAGAPAAQFAFQNMRTADAVKGLKEHSIDFGILRKSAVAASLKFLVPFSLLIGLGNRLEWRTAYAVAPPVSHAIEQIGRPFTASELTPVAMAAPAASSAWPILLTLIWLGGCLAVLL